MTNRTCVHIDSDDCLEKLAQSIKEQIRSIDKAYDEICVACIGTDKVIGDCLGPLVGNRLADVNGIKVRGKLKETLQATNLRKYIDSLSPEQLVIAVDACLGETEHIGHIIVECESIRPGSGVDKKIPAIGDISIKGIVGTYRGDHMDNLLQLYDVKLSFVMKMADAIASGLQVALST